MADSFLDHKYLIKRPTKKISILDIIESAKKIEIEEKAIHIEGLKEKFVNISKITAETRKKNSYNKKELRDIAEALFKEIFGKQVLRGEIVKFLLKEENVKAIERNNDLIAREIMI